MIPLYVYSYAHEGRNRLLAEGLGISGRKDRSFQTFRGYKFPESIYAYTASLTRRSVH